MVFRPKSNLRHEIKFLINLRQQVALLEELRAYLQPDAHGDEAGQYLVTSLYYDTPDYKAYWDKVDGFRFRRKVRVRIYGNQPVLPETPVFLEIKERAGVRMGKRRLALPYATAMALAAQADVPIPTTTAQDAQTLDELHYLFAALRLQPSSVVSYQRIAYGSHLHYPDLRITFDTDVRCRVENLSLLAADQSATHSLVEAGWAILEIKVNQTMPLWLGELLSRHGCTPRRISKYCASLERMDKIRQRSHLLLG